MVKNLRVLCFSVLRFFSPLSLDVFVLHYVADFDEFLAPYGETEDAIVMIDRSTGKHRGFGYVGLLLLTLF